MLIFSAKATNKTLKALALLAGTLTHGLRHFVPNFSPCVVALYAGVRFCLVLSFLSLVLCVPSRARLFLQGVIECLASAVLSGASRRKLSPAPQNQQPEITVLQNIAVLFRHEHHRSFGIRL